MTLHGNAVQFQPLAQHGAFHGQQPHHPVRMDHHQKQQAPEAVPYGKHQGFAGQHAASAVEKGTMDLNYRFPGSGTSMNVQSLAACPQQFTDNKPITGSTKPQQRDPRPYSNYSTSSKKEMLLQNLHEVVESSKAQGNPHNSSRCFRGFN